MLFAIVLFAACSFEDKGKKNSYNFIDQRAQNFEISTDFMTLKIKVKNPMTNKDDKQDDKVTLVMFFNFESAKAKDYFSNLNHLFSTFPKIRILGVSIQSSSHENLDSYAKENAIDFTLLKPIDSKNLFVDFIEFVRLVGTQNQANLDVQEISLKDEKTQDLELLKTPYFILYDKNGKKFQTYSGIILEEMFIHDISALLRIY